MNTRRVYMIFVPLADKKWLNANQPLFWAARAPRTKVWRRAAEEEARHAKIPRIQRGHIVAELHFGDQRRRDPANWAPTAKALVDGLVDAGVFEDDSYKFVDGPDMRLGASRTGGLRGVRLIVTVLE